MTPVPALLQLAVATVAVTAAARVAAEVVVDPAVRDAVVNGRAHVIVELRLAVEFAPEGELDAMGVRAQREAIAAAQQALVAALAASDARVVRQFETIPFLSLDIGARALADLRAMPERVTRIVEDDAAAPLQ